MPRLPQLSLYGVGAACCLIAIFSIAVKPVTDPDFWWHLATGRYMVEHWLIPHHDVFSLTAQDHRWITHEWVTELLFYGGWQLGGTRLLMLATAAVITLAFGLVYLAARERGAPAMVAAPIVVLAALASAHTWGTRPQMLSLLLTAVFGLAIARMLVRALPAPPLWLPVVMVLWVNLHGGFIFGIALLAIAVAGHAVADLVRVARARGRSIAAEPMGLDMATGMGTAPWVSPHPRPSVEPRVDLRRSAAVVALTALASLLNPNGLAGALYPVSYLGNNASTRYIAEWVSPDFHQFQYLFFEALVLLLLVGAMANPRRARLADALVLLPFLYLAFDSVRNINLLAVIAAPIAAELVAGALPGALRGERPGRPLPRAKVLLNWLCVLAIGAAVGASALGKLSASAQAKAVDAMYPSGALRYVQAHPLPGRGFDSYNWGGYLIWRLFPSRHVFVDGRPDMYGDSFMDHYVRAYGGDPSWDALFAANRLCYALVETDSGIARVLRTAPGWSQPYHDHVAALFVASPRRTGCPA